MNDLRAFDLRAAVVGELSAHLSSQVRKEYAEGWKKMKKEEQIMRERMEDYEHKLTVARIKLKVWLCFCLNQISRIVLKAVFLIRFFN